MEFLVAYSISLYQTNAYVVNCLKLKLSLYINQRYCFLTERECGGIYSIINRLQSFK